MALVLKDRVQETSITTGTGTITLDGAVPGYQSFAASTPSGSIVYYCITAQVGTFWEVGYGTFTSPDQLSRTVVYSSSNAGALVDFPAGTQNVFVTYPAEQAVYQQTTGLTEFNEGPISVVGANATPGSFSSTLAQFTSNEPNYSQLYIQNQSNDANASTDIAAYNELGDGTYFFVDMGIASSNYNDGTYPIFQANDAYLYSYGNATTVSRLMIGTESPDANVVVFAGGVDPNNTALTISGNNQSATFANSVTVTNTVSANNAQFTNFAYSGGNLANAANNTVLVTQAYVDNATAAGIDIHDAVNLATVAVLSGTPTYNQPGGAGNGVGATLTAAGVGTLSVDGQNAAFGFRILVQSQANAVQNGVYTVTTEGTGGAAYILTRATDSDTSATLTQGSYYFVNAGNTLAYNAFVVNTVGTINFGVTNITFAEFSRVPTYIGTSPINVSGQTISLTTVPVNKGGTNLTTFVAGDVVYANTANTISALAIGSQYNSLVVSAGALPSWGTIALGSANAVSGTLGPTNGGTGQSTYTLGDIIYSNATNSLAKLAGQTTTTQKFLSQTGDGANSAAPSWMQVSSGDITGLGTMSTQNANAVTITGGFIDNTAIGGFTPATGAFTNVNATTVTATTGSFTNVSGNGSAITAINASNISSGTIANARTTGNTANSASTLVLRDADGSFGANIVTATFSGNAAGLSAINASNISSGTIANARTTASSANGASTIVLRDAAGDFAADAITANFFIGDGSNVSAINGSNVTTGTIANARTTAATANGASTIVLRGASGEFAAGAITGTSFTGNGSALTAINASAITTGTIDNARTTAASANGASTIVLRDANGSFAGNVGTFTSITGSWNGSVIGAQYGGTGSANLTADNVILGNGANTVKVVAPGTANNVLTSNGSSWISQAPAAAGGFAAGTVMLFAQTSAPTGWTKNTTTGDNSALRVTTGAASTGGSVGFTTAFASQAVSGSLSSTTATNQAQTATNQAFTPAGSVTITAVSGTAGATTLSTPQIPSHVHSGNLYYQDGGARPFFRASGSGNFQGTANTNAEGGGGSHDHPFSFSSGSGTFSGSPATVTQNSHNHTQDAHNHTFTGTAINLAVQYIDVIRASKD
jgi:hypothetical protein